MDYEDYKVEDFVLDLRFRNWVLYPDRSSNLFWENWIEANPYKREVLMEARLIVLQCPEVKYPLSDEKADRLWQTIEEAISVSEDTEEAEKKIISLNPQSVIYTGRSRKLFRLEARYLLKVAAVLVVVLTGTLLLHYQDSLDPRDQKQELVVKRNPWGQKSVIYLNDGSEVTLNSGSSIQYSKYFSNEKRTLILEGEAYFKVAKDPARPFTVISDGLSTTALGTEFNIQAYPGQKLQVSLISGSVQVAYDDGQPGMILMPGEGVVSDADQQTISRVNVDERVLDWKNNILSFYDAGEAAVVKSLEQWYGVKIIIVNDSKKEWKYRGKFHKQSLEDVLISLGFAMDFEYAIDKDTITITYE